MSQRGPGSRRSSRSPVRSNQVSPTQYASQHGSSDVRYESVSATSTDASRMAQQLPPKALGVHNMLNPSELPPMSSEPGGRPPSRSRDHESTRPASSSTPYGASRPYFPGHAATSSLPATPVTTGVTPFGRPPMSEHNSPATTTYPPFPSLNNPRKMLSPRARAMSLGQTARPREFDPRQRPLAPTLASSKRPYEPDTTEEHRPPPGLRQPPVMASSAHPSMATPPRSLSLPLTRPSDGPHMPPQSIPPPGDHHSRPQVLHAPTQFQHGIPGMPTSRPLSRMGAPLEVVSAWPEMLRRQGVSGSFVGVDAQQAYMTLPGSDTPIPVQVDYSQASKKADEKRQRNAKASTRHRRKKKTLQEENLKQLQDLKDERQQMQDQLEEVLKQRDFYRDERNRLRDVVARTPAISKHAAGPPSPVLSKAIILFDDGSPVMQPRHMATGSQGYVSEASSVEQRRRTDDRSDFSAPVYGAPSGGPQYGLPSMYGHPYGVPSRPPSAASSASGERLPPLRSMEGPPPASGLVHGQPQEQDPRTGQWRSAQPAQYETGWATAPRKPQDAPQWQ